MLAQSQVHRCASAGMPSRRLGGYSEQVVRSTFIHVSGKPVEDPPGGGSVKKLHRASKDLSEKLIVEPGGGPQCALWNRAQSDQGA